LLRGPGIPRSGENPVEAIKEAERRARQKEKAKKDGRKGKARKGKRTRKTRLLEEKGFIKVVFKVS
jgi:hypothetical protein